MRRLDTTMDSKGRVSLPTEVRRALALRPDDKVLLELEGKTVRMRRAPSGLLTGYGAVATRRRNKDSNELRKEFVRTVAEEVLAET